MEKAIGLFKNVWPYKKEDRMNLPVESVGFSPYHEMIRHKDQLFRAGITFRSALPKMEANGLDREEPGERQS